MIKIYSKNYCPFCDMAKELFTSLGYTYEEIDVTNTPEVIMELSKTTWFRTVPQIFFWDKCMWGYSDVKALHDEWKLIELLK